MDTPTFSLFFALLAVAGLAVVRLALVAASGLAVACGATSGGDAALQPAAGAYGLTGFPYGVYLDGEQRVVARNAGEIEPDVVVRLLQQLAEA